MIKHIVFDMGKVMLNYEVDTLCSHFVEDEDVRERIKLSVFASTEWTLLDMGVITESAALERMKARLHNDEEKRLAETCFEHWHEYNLIPKPEMGELVKELKEKGYGVYLLSNASVRLRQCYRQVIPGIEYFDGVLFSAEERLLKPQKEIYQRFFEKFDLNPEECFFVDDLKENVEGGRACGMDGHCFADGDVERLKKRLEELRGLEI